ncbi:MAG: hypothetical protein P4L27_05450 [Ignavibacteriaceae bacterium]|nr:hypothetical protein [Ignavibacteriaceae bacterium]
MKDEIDLYELKEQVKDIFPKGFEGYKLLWDMLYHIRLLKYIRRSQLKEIDSRYSKICAAHKLIRLVEVGLIKNTQEDIFISTYKSLNLFKQLKYPTVSLPKNISGEGSINELNNTIVFIQALKLKDFKALLYPTFYLDNKPFLKPDALLVRSKGNQYKLEFLEIEASKPLWESWVEEKRINYLHLAQDKQAYAYWKSQCTYLDIIPPDIKDFKFSVSIIGEVKMDFETGFNFMERL